MRVLVSLVQEHSTEGLFDLPASLVPQLCFISYLIWPHYDCIFGYRCNVLIRPESCDKADINIVTRTDFPLNPVPKPENPQGRSNARWNGDLFAMSQLKR